MNLDNKQRELLNNSDRYLKTVGERYVFNPGSGLYEQVSTQKHGANDKERSIEIRSQPFSAKTEAPMDQLEFFVIKIPGLFISAATLVLLVMTVIFAGLQWEAIDKQFPEIKNSANAASRAANVASDTLRLSRAYLVAADTNVKGGGYGLLKISLRNYGHVAAKDVVFEGTLDRLSANTSPVIAESIRLHLPVAKTVVPSDVPTYTWNLFTPNFGSRFPVIGDALRVIGWVTYDDGFGRTDKANICYVFQMTADQWEVCGGDTSTRVEENNHRH